MENTIIVESAGVSGISSKITSFKIRIIISGVKLKIDDGVLYRRSILDASYKIYDENLGPRTLKRDVKLLKNCVNTEEMHGLIDEYCNTVLFEDKNKLILRKPISKLADNDAYFNTSEDLKNNLLSEINLAFTDYIEKNFIS